MLSGASRDWFLLDGRPVQGLGEGELLQSAATPIEFKSRVMLNSYESNCLRDWLAQRWSAKSLEQTTVFLGADSGLLIEKPMVENNALAAKTAFEAWVPSVVLDREQFIQSRK